MRDRMILVGAGDFAREVLWMIQEMRDLPNWDLAGLIDDYPDRAASALRTNGFGQVVLGTIADYLPKHQDRFVCTFGNPTRKLAAAEVIAGRGGQFVNLIHPTAAIGPGCLMGKGLIICRHAVVTANVALGNHVHLNIGATCGHDAKIGDGCTLSSHCDVTGHAVLEKGVFFGSHASVTENVRIGEFAVLGAGSVAFRNIPAGQTWLGVPAKSLLS